MADTEEKKPEGPKVFSFTPGFGEGTELADKFSGAGIADTVYGLVKSIGEHNTAGMAAYGVGLAFDVAGMLLNPLGSLLAAGVGWLIDHLFFLREPLDLLMGDPSAVKQNTDMIKEDAEKYNEVATAHTEALKALEKWTGKAAEAFKASMTQLTDEILAIGEAVKGAAQMMNTMGGCVAGFRSLIRDIIAALLGNLIAGALIAAGLAPITLGASIVAYVGVAVASAVATMGKIVPMLSKLSSMLSANKTALAQLDDMVHTVGVNLGRFDKPGGGGAAGTTTSSAAGAGGKIHTPPTTGSNSAGTSASGAGSSAAGAGGKIHTPPTTGTNSAGTTTSSAGTSTAGAGGKINTPPTTGTNSAGTTSGAGTSGATGGGKINTPPTTGTNSAGTTTSGATTSTAGAGGKINTPPTTGSNAAPPTPTAGTATGGGAPITPPPTTRGPATTPGTGAGGSNAAGAGGKVNTPPTTGSNTAGSTTSGATTSTAGAGGKVNTPPTTGTNSTSTTTSGTTTGTAGGSGAGAASPPPSVGGGNTGSGGASGGAHSTGNSGSGSGAGGNAGTGNSGSGSAAGGNAGTNTGSAGNGAGSAGSGAGNAGKTWKERWDDFKTALKDLEKAPHQKMVDKLVNKFGWTPERAEDFARWVKNFEGVAAPGGTIKIGGREVPTGNVMHEVHEIWKEISATQNEHKKDDGKFMTDLKDYRDQQQSKV